MQRTRWLPLGLALAAWLFAGAALAHSGDATGFASLSVRDALVTYAYTPTDKSTVDRAALPAQLRAYLQVEADGQPCRPQPGTDLSLRFDCGHPVSRCRLHSVPAALRWPNGRR